MFRVGQAHGHIVVIKSRHILYQQLMHCFNLASPWPQGMSNFFIQIIHMYTKNNM
jgi:hypothetical protein